MSDYTKGEWKVFVSGKIIEIQDEDGNPIVKWSGFDDCRRPLKEHKANAKLIVKAVNAMKSRLSAAGKASEP
jgi:hypothetical protein